MTYGAFRVSYLLERGLGIAEGDRLSHGDQQVTADTLDRPQLGHERYM